LSVLASLQSTKAYEGPISQEEGWSTSELLSAALFATVATGGFLYGSTLSASPAPKLIHRGGGGGGHGGGGSGVSSIPASNVKEEEEERHVLVSNDDKGGPYQVSIQAIRGGRLTMEDEYFVTDGGRFAAVFDGHGGGGVSSLLRDRLYKLMNQHLKSSLEFQDNSPFRPSLASSVAALRSAFQQIDAEVLLDDTLQYQGSTAVAVLVHEGDDGHKTILSANVGDSRAILSRNRKAVNLTRDHKPNDEREKARIMAMGETIEWDHYCKVHRVRNLSLSRAIGDRFAKPVVTGEVEIKHFPEVNEGDEFFLLASDGVWDVMDSQDVVDFVHNQLDSIPNSDLLSEEDRDRLIQVRRKNMSHAIAKEALRKGSGDNICVVLVWLDE
jgi:serine/threonine protein phosphatase PrpC